MRRLAKPHIQITCDMLYVTCDMRHTEMMDMVLKFQVPSSNSLGMKVFYDFEEKEDIITCLINHKGVYRTSQATPCGSVNN